MSQCSTRRKYWEADLGLFKYSWILIVLDTNGLYSLKISKMKFLIQSLNEMRLYVNEILQNCFHISVSHMHTCWLLRPKYWNCGNLFQSEQIPYFITLRLFRWFSWWCGYCLLFTSEETETQATCHRWEPNQWWSRIRTQILWLLHSCSWVPLPKQLQKKIDSD